MKRVTGFMLLIFFLISTTGYAQEAGSGLPKAELEKAKLARIQVTSEQAPGTVAGTVQYTDNEYDLQFEYPCGDASGEAGTESDGNFIYTTKWNGSGFFKYGLDGTFYGSFQVGTVQAVRDLAFDGIYMYGGAASTTIYQMDFTSLTLVGTMTAGTATRAIAYDEGEDAFWSNNWSTPIVLWDRTGAVLNTIATAGDESYYGFAYDPQGPFLWGYSQRVGTSQNMLYKMALPGGTQVGSFDMLTILTLPVAGTDIAGGLYFHPDLVQGTNTLGGIVQNKCIWGIEMGTNGSPLTIDVGVTAIVSPVSGPFLGNETVTITVKNFGASAASNIPVNYTLDGGAPLTGILAGPIAAGATVEFTFPGTVNLGNPGQTYVFVGCTALAGDENPNNNCKTANVTNVIPTYCDASTTTEDEYIANVLCGEINNSSGWQGGVADYTTISTQIDAGMSEDITITNGNAWASDIVYCWADWNQDFTFGTGNEQFMLTNVGGTGQTFTGTISVPASVPNGEYRFRIRMTYSTAPTPCGSATYGEIEDYTIVVGNGVPVLNPPYNLTGTYIAPNSAQLNWSPPEIQGEWLSFCGPNLDGLGLEGGGTFYAAAHWDAASLVSYEDFYLTKVSVYSNSTQNATFILKVWTGVNGGTLVLNQPLSGLVMDEWNEIDLSTPVQIVPSSHLWVGYQVTHIDGDNPAGLDAGPAIAQYGDMVSFDGTTWESLSTTYGLDYNFNIKAYATQQYDGEIAQSLPNTISDNTIAENKTRSVLTGYNIYRDDVLIGNTTNAVTTYLDTELDPGVYSYKVTAVYEEGESEPAGPVEVTVGEITILVTPNFFEESLETGTTSTHNMIITNSGDLPLIYSIEIEDTNENTYKPVLQEPNPPDSPEAIAALNTRMAFDGIKMSLITLAHGNAGGVSPNQTDEETIRYDNGVNFDAIGLTSGGTFQVAAYWPAANMAQYAGMELQKVEMYIESVPSPCKIKIYGQGTSTTPGALLYEQTVIPTGFSWNLFDLNFPVAITGQDIWIGYEVTHLAGEFVAGCDAGPAFAGYGDMITLDGVNWDPLSSYGLDYNWNLVGYIGYGTTFNNDVSVTAFLSPVSVPWLGNETVTIRVKNFGTNSVSNIPVSYTLDGGAAVTGTLAGPIASGATADFSFPATVNLGNPGQTYVFVGCTALAGDENPNNNCKTHDVTNVIPTYCDATTQVEDEYIANVLCGDINNSSGWQGGVADYTAISTQIDAGMSEDITITNGNAWASDIVYCWVDWNKDFDFGTGDEQFMLTNVGGTGQTFTGAITVPVGVPNGEYRFRIRMTYSTAPLPCGDATYGEIEDYTIVVGGFTNWLSVNPAAGTVPAREAASLDVIFDAQGVPNGFYSANILISSNATNNPMVSIPAMLVVYGGVPNIQVNPTSLNFDATPVGGSTIQTVVVSNTGMEVLAITGVSIDNPDFVVVGSSNTINAGSSYPFEIEFYPSGIGVISGILTITSNDPDQPAVTVNLFGTGYLEAPQNLNASVLGYDVTLWWDPPYWDQSTALLGYNIYKDGLYYEFIYDNYYEDFGVAPGEHQYQVSALYDEGESELTPPVYIFAGEAIIAHNPGSFLFEMNPNEIETQTLTISNTGTTPLNISMGITYTNQMPTFVSFDVIDHKSQPNTAHLNAERTPENVPGNVINTTDAMWDLQFSAPAGDASGEAGIETDGNFIYTTKWNGVGFFKYEMDGTFLGAMTIGSIGNIRDLAYDGTYMYGGAAATTVYKMDFSTQTLVGQFTAPTDVRAIAYDYDEDGFYANNWSTPIVLFDVSGATLNTLPTTGNESYYGFAYDNNNGNKHLYGFSQQTGLSGGVIFELALPGGTPTGVSHDVISELATPGTDLAGGLFTCNNWFVNGTTSIGGLVQNVVLFAYELHETGGPVEWLNLSSYSATINAGSSEDIDVICNTQGLTAGALNFASIWIGNNSANNQMVEVPVTLITTEPEPVIAAFSAAPLSGSVPLTVNFSDLSSGNILAWEWDFDNDGTIDSYVQNPEYTYTEEGVYSVKLTVSNSLVSDFELKTDYISVVSEPTHFIPIWTSPYNPMTFYVLAATIDEEVLGNGAEVGLFDIDPNTGYEICVGAGLLSVPLTGGAYLEMVASMDDGSISGQANGFTPGHEIIYKLWSETTGETSSVQASYPYPGYDENYTSQGTAFVELNGFTTITQEISLQTGWNILSFRVEPLDWNMLNIVQPIIDLGILNKVLDEAGGSIFHLPFPPPNGQWSNTIGNMANTEGYYVKVTGDGSLSLEGYPVETPMDIPLTTGWNIISYPCESPQNALTAVQPLIDAGVLFKVIDEAGGTIFHLPFPPPNGQWSNTIGNFESGEGYYVKVTGNAVLSVSCDGFENTVLAEIPVKKATSHFVPAYTGNPYFPMDVVVKFNAELQPGDEVAVFDGELCVGASVVGSDIDYVIVTCSKDDNETANANGFTPGNNITIKGWKNDTQQVYESIVTEHLSGDEEFTPLGTKVSAVTEVITNAGSMAGDVFSVEIYPNPVTNQSVVWLTIPTKGTLELLVTDLSGKEQCQIFNDEIQSGFNKISLGKMNLKSGCYFLKYSYNSDGKITHGYSKFISVSE